jgi:hypothetical protein
MTGKGYRPFGKFPGRYQLGLGGYSRRPRFAVLESSSEDKRMSEVKVKDGRAYCKQCGRDVAVKEKPGDQAQIGRQPHVLVDRSGHVVAERATKQERWEEAA